MSRAGRVLITTDAVGGVWQYATDLAQGLSARGWQSVLALIGPPPSEPQRRAAAAIPRVALVDTGLELDWLAADPQRVAATGDAVAALAADCEADVVQLNLPALAARSRFATPVVAVAHSCVATWWDAMHGSRLPRDFAWRAALVGAGLKAADRVVTPSAAFAEATRRAHALRARPSVVHNGRAPLPLPTAAIHDFCFTAGRLWDKGKNIAALDRMAARLAVPFHAAGPLRGPNGELATVEHLHPLGQVEEAEIARRLAARPLFVSAARYEPFGLSVLEAAAAGCPLLLSDISTFRELWDGAATFIAPDDDRAFAEAAQAILGDTTLRLSLGAAARARAARYSVDAMADGMAAIYRSLLHGRGRRRAAA